MSTNVVASYGGQRRIKKINLTSSAAASTSTGWAFPPKSILLNGWIDVNTIAAGETLNIGTSASAALFGSAMSIATATQVMLDGTIPSLAVGDEEVYVDTVSASTTLDVDIYLEYVEAV